MRTLMIEHRGVQSEALFDALRDGIRLVGFEQENVAADLALQLCRRAQGYDVAFGVDRQAVAALGLFHQVRRDQHRYMFFIAQDLQILPEIAARAGIEAGGRLVQQQHRGMMQQALGQLQATLHAAGKCLGLFLRPVGQSHARKHFSDTFLQRGPAQSVNMADNASGSLLPSA